MSWRAAAATTFTVRQLDDELLVYHVASGDTHLLGSDAAAILLELRQGPRDAASLAELIAALHATPLDDTLLRETESLLTDLESFALIEPA